MRLPCQRCLVFPHLRGGWERPWVSSDISEARRPGVIYVALLPKMLLGLALFIRKSQNSWADTSQTPSDSMSSLSASTSGCPSVCLPYLPPPATPWGYGLCCSLCLQGWLLSSFLRQGFLTLQISVFHVSFPEGVQVRFVLSHFSFVSLSTWHLLARLCD